MHKLLILFFIGSFNMTFGQNLQNGLILPKQNADQQNCCIYAPKVGFAIYDQPNGKVIGQITSNVEKNVGDQASYRIYFVDYRTQTEEEIGLQHLKEIGYEIWAFTYVEIRNGFVKFQNGSQDLWLKESAIEKAGFELVAWQTFIAERAENLLGFYAHAPGLNLREQPHAASRKIKTLKGETHQISPTNQHSGLWTKVKVTISKEHPCVTDLSEEENFIEELEGWIKIMDDNGIPNVWYYSRGC
ncbi:MAG: hypothetical protein ABI263_00745 [Gelidibacter sp.]